LNRTTQVKLGNILASSASIPVLVNPRVKAKTKADNTTIDTTVDAKDSKNAPSKDESTLSKVKDSNSKLKRLIKTLPKKEVKMSNKEESKT